MLHLYEKAMKMAGPLLEVLLRGRLRRGKEDPARLGERRGVATLPRPPGPLIWCHAASVGESQSALALINRILAAHPNVRVLVTTGTLTSATLMATRLPVGRAFHQFYPLDNPAWVRAFLGHWQPDLALWLESELWPSMIGQIKARKIPAILINARLSARSFRHWKLAGNMAAHLLSAFQSILTQTEADAERFKSLGAAHVAVTDNIKYSADPLPHDPSALAALTAAVKGRPLWLYASTHKGEESLACRLHKALKADLPDLLTVIVPRHPDRGPEIFQTCQDRGLTARRRDGDILPQSQDDIYIADTLGELGLFYRLCPLACIGRSFSDDGGGGHNPIEAAQLGCAVLHGPHVQNLADIFHEMDLTGAALALRDEDHFAAMLKSLLSNDADLSRLQNAGKDFADRKSRVLSHVMTLINPTIADILGTDQMKGARQTCA